METLLRLIWVRTVCLCPIKNLYGLSIFTSDCQISLLFVCLFVCFVALRPKSTAMVIAGRSDYLTTLFSWASLNKQLTSKCALLSLVTDNNPS